MGGVPVFIGTRVPVQTLFDYLTKAYSLNDFLQDFPSVKRSQALAALAFSGNALIASAHPA